MKLRQDDIAVTSNQIKEKTLALDSGFHGGDTKKLWYWVYDFYKKWKLSIRSVTHEGQKLSTHIESIKKDFIIHLQRRF